jgi:hypothetical protein
MTTLCHPPPLNAQLELGAHHHERQRERKRERERERESRWMTALPSQQWGLAKRQPSVENLAYFGVKGIEPHKTGLHLFSLKIYILGCPLTLISV